MPTVVLKLLNVAAPDVGGFAPSSRNRLLDASATDALPRAARVGGARRLDDGRLGDA